MTRVRIIFDGTMAIGPAYPKQPHGPYKKRGPLFAVLPHGARQQTRRSEGTTPEFIPVHVPGIFSEMTAEGRLHDLKYKDYYLWCPLRERMEFAIDKSADPTDIIFDHDPHYDPSCNNITETVTDIAAISDMREIWPGRRRLRRGMLSRKAGVSRRVAAQVFIPGGHVSSNSEYVRKPNHPKQNICATFLPKKTPTVLEKRILPQVVVTIEVENQIEIKMRSLDSGKELDSIIFRFEKPVPARKDIWIVNGDLENFQYVIDELSKPIPPATPITASSGAAAAAGETTPPFRPGDPAVDFELIYRVLGGPDHGGLPIPYVRPVGQRPCYTVLVEPEPTSLFSLFS